MNPLTEELLDATRALYNNPRGLPETKRTRAAVIAWAAAGCPDAPPTPNLPACEINGHRFAEGNVWCIATREDAAVYDCPRGF